jgi:HSP20 family molecular chaperone IbpA
MKNNLNIPQELLLTTDFLNTTGGGMSMSQLTVSRNEGGYQVEARVPGVSADNLKVDVLQQRLLIYHMIQGAGNSPLYRQSAYSG